MDHLTIPPGVIPPAITILYRASKENYYHGQGFFDYPSRQGWTENDLRGENNFGQRSNKDVEIFFQTWLYFGLAIEIFKAVGIAVVTEDFLSPSISPVIEHSVVTTRKLPALLMQWEKLYSDCQGSAHPPAWDTIRQILDRVCYFLDRNCTISKKRQMKRQTSPAQSPWPVSDEVSTSIMALGSTLRTAAITYFRIPSLGPNWTTGSSRMLKAALESKFCRSDAALILEDLPIDGHYYFAASEGRDLTYLRAHEQCSDAGCFATINEETYVTRHAPKCSDEKCKTLFERPCLTSFIESVVRVIDGGGTPILYWNEERRQLRVDEYNPMKGFNPFYVAISHIWADGMGNPVQNRLPDCQLRRIQSMVNALDIPDQDGGSSNTKPGSGSPRSVSGFGFWMDTLCIPVGAQYGEQKKLSIRKMRHIYQEASAVLVLDYGMMQSTISLQTASQTAFPVPKARLTAIERCARLYTSNWTRRLWTLQEGLLNNTVFLQWQNGPENLYDLSRARITWEKEARARGVLVSFPIVAASKAVLYFRLFRDIVEMIGAGQAGPEERADLFVPLADALSTRATTRESDETLCLSTVLGLDPKPFLEIENADDNGDVVERRMERFVRMLGTFDAGLVFNSYRKLQRDGVRWAPRSLLQHSSADLGPVTLSDQRATIETVGRFSGLAVRFPGFITRGSSHFGHSRAISIALKEPCNEFIRIELDEGELLPSLGNQKPDCNSRFAVIWPSGDLDQLDPEPCRGIIGQVKADGDYRFDGEDIIIIQYLSGIMISRLKRNLGVRTAEGDMVSFRRQDSWWLIM
ncbi:hypothetical protein ZTR_09851 [Talaromyces verruculosus]|nr:hypothetical protein ZTR_09851 [Talaromyces verruculosus]